MGGLAKAGIVGGSMYVCMHVDDVMMMVRHEICGGYVFNCHPPNHFLIRIFFFSKNEMLNLSFL
jgi:hypothetical protein